MPLYVSNANFPKLQLSVIIIVSKSKDSQRVRLGQSCLLHSVQLLNTEVSQSSIVLKTCSAKEHTLRNAGEKISIRNGIESNSSITVE